jgi:hypothetical protein
MITTETQRTQRPTEKRHERVGRRRGDGTVSPQRHREHGEERPRMTTEKRREDTDEHG